MKKILLAPLIIIILCIVAYTLLYQQPSSPLDVSAEIQYCLDNGGVVEDQERDGQKISTCFVNDGKDGIRCNLDLFYKNKCAADKPEIADDNEVKIGLNYDPENLVAMIMKAPNGEGIAISTKIIDGTEHIEKMIIVAEDKQMIVVTVNEFAIPTSIEFDGGIATFSNHTDTTIDITVTNNDGSTELIENFATTPPEQTSWISRAYAMTPMGMPEPGATRESQILGGYYPKTSGQIFDFVTCGLGTGAAVVTAGWALPLTYFSCGKVALRVVTSPADTKFCDGDVVECMTEAFYEWSAFEVVVEGASDGWDALFPTGVLLKGTIRNSITNTPVPSATVRALDLTTSENIRGEVSSDGSYEIQLPSGGSYTLEINAEGYKLKETFNIAISDNTFRFQKVGKEGYQDQSIEPADQVEVEQVLLVIPDGIIEGELIDSEEGLPIDGKLTILLNDKVGGESITDDDGIFIIEPDVIQDLESAVLVGSAEGYTDTKVSISLTYHLAGDKNHYELGKFSGVIKLDKEESGSTKDFDGTWTGEAANNSSDPTCIEYANVKFKVKKGKLTGSADADGFKYSLQGDVSSDGTISVGFADGDYETITFTGKLDRSNNGEGKWDSATGCYGNWYVSQ